MIPERLAPLGSATFPALEKFCEEICSPVSRAADREHARASAKNLCDTIHELDRFSWAALFETRARFNSRQRILYLEAIIPPPPGIQEYDPGRRVRSALSQLSLALPSNLVPDVYYSYYSPMVDDSQRVQTAIAEIKHKYSTVEYHVKRIRQVKVVKLWEGTVSELRIRSGEYREVEQLSCLRCHGQTSYEPVTFRHARHKSKGYVFFAQVHAHVCKQCDREYYLPDVAQELTDALRKALAAAGLLRPQGGGQQSEST